MTTLSISEAQQKSSASAVQSSVFIALADAYRGFVALTRNGMVALGAGFAVLVIALAVQSELRSNMEQLLLSWLQERQDSAVVAADDAVPMPENSNDDRLAVAPPPLLPKQQAAVTQWLSRKYRVAPEPLAALVTEAYAIGERIRIDPSRLADDGRRRSPAPPPAPSTRACGRAARRRPPPAAPRWCCPGSGCGAGPGGSGDGRTTAPRRHRTEPPPGRNRSRH